MNIKITWAKNGIHVSEKENEWSAIYPDTTDGKLEFLNDFIDVMGWRGSRYDKERIGVQVYEGDKYEAPKETDNAAF